MNVGVSPQFTAVFVLQKKGRKNMKKNFTRLLLLMLSGDEGSLRDHWDVILLLGFLFFVGWSSSDPSRGEEKIPK